MFRVPKAAERIALSIRRQIVQGHLQPDDPLPSEQDMMTHFGVSRPTLREALRILESESLVEIRRGVKGGAVVRRPLPHVAARHVSLLLQLEGTTMAEVYECRVALEPVAARYAARRGQAAAEPLGVAIAAELAAGYDVVAHRLASESFHHALVHESGHRALRVLNDMLMEISRAHAHAAAATSADDHRVQIDRAIKGHQRLVQLVHAGDEVGAEEFWRQHLTGAFAFFFGRTRGPTVVDLLD